MLEIRGLTLWRPWAWALFHGKPVENRDWPAPRWHIGQMLAIHAGKKLDRDGERFVREVLKLQALPPEARAEGIIGVALLDRCIGRPLPGEAVDPVCLSPWFFGLYGWVLRDQVEFKEPVPCRGMQGLWPLPPDVLALVRQRWMEVRYDP